MPSTLSMAATFSREEAAANGGVIGRDARALGVDVILEPYINMYRDSTFERAYNTLGRRPSSHWHSCGPLRGRRAGPGRDGMAKHMVVYEVPTTPSSVVRRCARSISCRSRRSSMSVSLPSCARTTGSMAFYSCANEGVLERTLRSESVPADS